MITMVRTISTIMVEYIVVSESNTVVLPTIVAEGCNGWKRRECVYLCDG